MKEIIRIVCIIALIGAMMVMPAAATTWYVHNGESINDYTTFHEAHWANVSSGDTVFVYNGTYGHFHIDKPNLTVIGEGADVVTIDCGGGLSDRVRMPGPNGNATGSVLDGFKVVNSVDGISVGAFSNPSPNCIVRNCVFDGMTGCPEQVSFNSTVMNNVFLSVGGASGICIKGSNCTFRDNLVLNATGCYGAMDVGGEYNLIINNTIKGSTGLGISLDYDDGNNIITQNNIISNGDCGIEMYGTGEGNKIYLNNFIDNGVTVTTCGTTPPTVTYWNSTEPITYTYNPTCTNYLGNYWGAAYTGVDNDGDGIGDTPYTVPESCGEDYHPLVEPFENYPETEPVPPPEPPSVKTATGSGTATFESSAGTIVDLTAIAESAMPGGGPDLMHPHGFFSFEITDLTPGQTVEVTVTLPADVPEGTQYWKHDGSAWVQIPIGDDDGDNVITIQLTDGGLGDSGGVDGTIVDPGGIGVTNCVYLDPDNSVSQGSPVQVDVYTYINATDTATASSFDIEYDPNCVKDYPIFDGTGSGWSLYTNSTPDSGLLRFTTSVGTSSPISGHVKVGTLTFTNNTTCCGTFLNFTNAKYSSPGGTIYPATDNGTFLCEDPNDPIMKVTKEVWDESTSSWADTIGPLGSEWMDKDVRFKITATAGCLDLSGVAVNDAMNNNLVYNNSATLAEDSSTAHTVNWTIGALAAGTSQSIEFNATIAGYGTNCNTATVTGTVTSLGADAPTVSDDAYVTTMPPAGINVTKTVWDESTSSWVDMITGATIGDTYRFRCEVENIGSPGMDVCDITVIDVLPAGLSYADNAKLQSHHGTWWDLTSLDIDDPANNTYGWVVNNWVPGECLQVGQKIVIEYDVTVDNYGLSCNDITAEAYCSAATSWVQDNDSACIDVPKPDLNVTAGNSIKVNPEVPYLADYAFGPVDHPGKRTQPNSISAEVQECNGVDVVLPFDVTIVVTNSTTSAVVATCTTTLPGLAGGTEVTVWCNDSWYPTAGWDYTIDVTVDPADVIPETDETNNTLLRDITAHNHGLKGGSWQSADSNITTLQYHNGTVNLLYSTGDSKSTGSTALQTAQGVYLTNWTAGNFPIPVAGSTIKKARLYVYYNWEKTADRNVTDYFTLDFNGYVLPQDAVYSDVKAPDLPSCGYGCADPIRKYAYPYGMVAYDVTHKFLVNNDNTATLTTDSDIWSNKKVSMTGMLLVIVYENSAERERTIWINEGFDMLKAGEYYYDHKYVGVNTEEATTHAPFTGCPPIDVGGKADLVTVVNHPTRSGNLDQEQALYFNGMLLEQGYNVWNRSDPALEIGINTADVTALLQPTENIASIQSVDDAAPAGDPSALGGDWFEASNAFLIVDKAITIIEVVAPEECIGVTEQFDVLINVTPMGASVYGVEYELSFDSSVIHAEWQNEGDFLKQGGANTNVYINDIDNGAGKVTFAVTRKDTLIGATVPGTLATVHFTAMQMGANTTMTLTSVKASNPEAQPINMDNFSDTVYVCDNVPPVAVPDCLFKFNNVGTKYMSKTYFDGSASTDDGSITNYRWYFGDGNYGAGETYDYVYGSWNWNGASYDPFEVILTVEDDGTPMMDNSTTMLVNVYIAGDANGDGEVDIFDATIVGLEWDEECVSGSWGTDDRKDQADLNNDCVVDIFDAVIIGANWDHTAW